MYKRIIARLDIKNNYLVKGINFEGLRVLGKPENFSLKYFNDGIDEIHYQDVVASLYERNSLKETISKTVKNIFVTFCVSGGLRKITDIDKMLRLGADKISLNSAAVKNPKLIKDASDKFGSSTICINIDVIKNKKDYEVLIESGREKTNLRLFDWLDKIQYYGAGEICLTSISHEGKQKGYDINLYKMVKNKVNIPLVAHGGCGSLNHLLEVLEFVDAASISSYLHYSYLNKFKNKLKNTGNLNFLNQKKKNQKNINILEIKNFLKKNNIDVR